MNTLNPRSRRDTGLTRLRRTLPVILALAVLSALTTAPARALTESQQDAAIASLQSTVAAQQTTINALLAKLKYVTTAGTDMTISGANLHVVSGSGHTNAAPNGLGNVIIGYDEARASGNVRTGSHNLILGAGNNYSSYGGLVAGYNNSVSGIYAAVTGGRLNAASGQFASVSGGSGNTASGDYAAVGGGQAYSAGTAAAFLPTSASQASLQNFQTQINSLQSTTSSLQSGVTQATHITGLFSLSNGVGTNTELTLTGVNLHLVNGLGATNGEPGSPYDTSNSVTNGLGNLIIGYNETRGGNSDTYTGSHNLILGQQNNYSSYGGIVAGLDNTITAPFASVTGGDYNTAGSLWATVSGGYQNTASNYDSSVSGGEGNTASGVGSSVGGGYINTASGEYGAVSGGFGNTAGGERSSVTGGYDNVAGGYYASVSGGYFNNAGNTGASISGGESGTADGLYSSVSGGKSVNNPQDYEWAAGTYHSQ